MSVCSLWEVPGLGSDPAEQPVPTTEDKRQRGECVRIGSYTGWASTVPQERLEQVSPTIGVPLGLYCAPGKTRTSLPYYWCPMKGLDHSPLLWILGVVVLRGCGGSTWHQLVGGGTTFPPIPSPGRRVLQGSMRGDGSPFVIRLWVRSYAVLSLNYITNWQTQDIK